MDSIAEHVRADERLADATFTDQMCVHHRESGTAQSRMLVARFKRGAKAYAVGNASGLGIIPGGLSNDQETLRHRRPGAAIRIYLVADPRPRTPSAKRTGGLPKARADASDCGELLIGRMIYSRKSV